MRFARDCKLTILPAASIGLLETCPGRGVIGSRCASIRLSATYTPTTQQDFALPAWDASTNLKSNRTMDSSASNQRYTPVQAQRCTVHVFAAYLPEWTGTKQCRTLKFCCIGLSIGYVAGQAHFQVWLANETLGQYNRTARVLHGEMFSGSTQRATP